MGDIGINATTSILEHLKEQVAEQHIKEPSQCKQLLIDSTKTDAGRKPQNMSLRTGNP